MTNVFSTSHASGDQLNSDHYMITGRIRDESNQPVEGFIVQAFDEDPGIYGHPDDRLGRAKTERDGAFKIIFDRSAFEDWFESNPEIYLTVRDCKGRVSINSQAKENTTRIADFQIKISKSKIDPLEPDLYSGNFARMTSAFKAAFDPESLSSSDARTVIEVISRALGSWVLYRDGLARLAGYDGVQVPEHPRKENHDHVVRWDRPVLQF